MKPFFACLLFLGFGAGNAQRTYSLIWKPKPNDAAVYELIFETKQEQDTLLYSADLTVRIRSVEPNGDYTTETSYSHSSVTTAGRTEKVESDSTPVVTKFNARGDQISKPEALSDDAFTGTTFGDLVEFKAPNKAEPVGGTWVATSMGSPQEHRAPSRTEYRLESVNNNLARITFVFLETRGDHPATGKGAFTLNASDGSTVGIEATLTGIQDDGDPAPTTATIKLKKKLATK